MTGALARGSPAVREEAAFVPALLSEIRQVIVGQDYLVNRLLVALLCDGHVLIEGVPGLAKTLAVKTLSEALQVRFSRIQFTPDMLPADINGTLIFNPNEGTFTPRFGPIFANLVLADEINRAPAKVQSALLEAMQEKQVSIGGSTYPLESPFMVLATQNPIEHEGTYPLPEAQVDRFMLKVIIGYPGKREEKLIMERMTAEQAPHARPVVTPAVLLAARQAMRAIHLQEELKDYIIQLVFSTREPDQYRLKDLKPLVAYGASPRASINLALASRAVAFLDGRGYVLPEDIKAVAPDVLRHRIILTYEAEAQDLTTDAVVERVLSTVPVP